MVPDLARESFPQVHQSHPPVLLLAFFDGIVSAATALHDIGIKISGYLSWEVDPECKSIVEFHFHLYNTEVIFHQTMPRPSHRQSSLWILIAHL